MLYDLFYQPFDRPERLKQPNPLCFTNATWTRSRQTYFMISDTPRSASFQKNSDYKPLCKLTRICVSSHPFRVMCKLAFHPPVQYQWSMVGETITRHGPYWADWVEIIGRVASRLLASRFWGTRSSNLENSFPQFSGVRSISHWRLELLARAIDGAIAPEHESKLQRR